MDDEEVLQMMMERCLPKGEMRWPREGGGYGGDGSAGRPAAVGPRGTSPLCPPSYLAFLVL
jgi:hypothetical protein